MVKDDSDLHVFVSQMAIIVPKKHNFVLIFEPVVKDGNIGRTMSYIKETILALIQRIVIYPHFPCSDQSDRIPIHLT